MTTQNNSSSSNSAAVYTLCPNTTLVMMNNEEDTNAQLPLVVVRPHTLILCPKTHTCVLDGGTTQAMVASHTTVSTLLNRLLRRNKQQKDDDDEEEEQEGNEEEEEEDDEEETSMVRNAIQLLNRLDSKRDNNNDNDDNDNNVLTNVTLQGITFRGTKNRNVNVYVASPTHSTTFKECLFTDNKSHSLVLVASLDFIFPSETPEGQRQRLLYSTMHKEQVTSLDSPRGRRLQNVIDNTTMSVVLDTCVLENNVIRMRGGYGGLISAFADDPVSSTIPTERRTKTRLVIQNSWMVHNQYAGTNNNAHSYLIANTFGSLSLENNCFTNNTVSLGLVLDNNNADGTTNTNNFASFNTITSPQLPPDCAQGGITEILEPHFLTTATSKEDEWSGSCFSFFSATTCDWTNHTVEDAAANETTPSNTTTNETTLTPPTLTPTPSPSIVEVVLVNETSTEKKNDTLTSDPSKRTKTKVDDDNNDRNHDAIVLGTIIPGIVLLIFAMSICGALRN